MAFINVSIQESSKWIGKKYNAARCYGKITDIVMKPYYREDEIPQAVNDLFDKITSNIKNYNKDVVYIEGDGRISSRLIPKLKEQNIRCLRHRSSKRILEENFPYVITKVRVFKKFEEI